MQKVSFGGNKINVLVYNDSHGSIANLDSFEKAQDEFYLKHKDETNITLSGGDVFLDKNENNSTVAKVLGPRTDAIGIGNHDLEAGNYFGKFIEKFGMLNKWVAANITFSKKNDIENNISKSTIITKNNERIGVIGVAPFDFKKIVFVNKSIDFINILPIDQTIKLIRQEVKKLESNGVNKIFLLAHTGEYSKDGENYYEQFSKIGGIDVILGGHDHIQVDKWLKSERNEPVKVISTGRNSNCDYKENLNMVGYLNLEFDADGVLKQDNCKSWFENIENKVQKQPVNCEIICRINRPLVRSNPCLGHSEVSNVVADSCLWYVNSHTKGEKADFSFVNAGTIRANFDCENVSLEDVKSVVPFTSSTLIKTNLTKKQIIETLKWCALSTTFGKITPGIMHVSGMEYTINADLSVSDVHILNKDGSIKYNLDDYSDDDEFSAVYDVFLATGVAGLRELKKDLDNDKSIEYFDCSRQDALYEYLKHEKNLYDCESIRIKCI